MHTHTHIRMIMCTHVHNASKDTHTAEDTEEEAVLVWNGKL